MTTFLRHKEDILQELILKTHSHKAGSSDSDKDIDTDTDTNTSTNRGYNEESVAVSGSQVRIWSRPQDIWNSNGVHPSTGSPSELRIQESLHVKKDSKPITVFLLFFMEVIQLMLIAETNKNYSQYLDTFHNIGRCSLLPDMSVQDMYTYSAIIIQMGHDVKDTPKTYWFTAVKLLRPFYTDTMKCDRFLHRLRFLHFSDNMNQPDKNDNNNGRL